MRLLYGAILWSLCIQFFVFQWIVKTAWTTPYSWSRNYISDLGAAYCTNRPDGFVCSPLGSVMNASFILQGLLIFFGTVLLRGAFPPGRLRMISLALTGISGPALILVGLAPEDVSAQFHFTGAAIHLISGNLGMILLGLVLMRSQKVLGALSLGAGAVGLLAVILLGCGIDLGWGVGGIERVGGYPFPMWLTGTGLFFLLRGAPKDNHALG